MLNGKIEDFFEIGSGNSGLTENIIYLNQPKSKDTAVKVFSSSTQEKTSMSFIDEGTYIKKNSKMVNIKIYQSEGIIIARNGKAGNMIYVNEDKYTMNDHAYVLYVKDKYKKDINIKYVLYKMRAICELCVTSDKGGNRTFNKTLFEKMEVVIPTIKEQNKIVDEYIRIEELYKLLLQKKEELQNTMFKIVKVNGAIYKVGDVFKVLAGKRIKEEDVYYHKGCFPCATAQTTNSGITWYADRKWLESISSKSIITEECITWTKDGAKTGTMFYRDYPFYANDHCGVLIPKSEFKNKIYMKWFVFSQVHNIRQAVTARTGQTMLYIEQMKGVTFRLPSYKKQIEIAEEYEKLDVLNKKIENAINKIEQVLYV
ncbi:MAG: restriction endonuclease subunit S [Lachnospiraceae bacterium]|nr:restriction endonuclease subunit S [Lachnospiraceae bacterium]